MKLITTYEERKIFLDGIINDAVSSLPSPLTGIGTPPALSLNTTQSLSLNTSTTSGYPSSTSVVVNGLPTVNRAPAGSQLEKNMKAAAQEHYIDERPTAGQCGGYTYRMAARLAKKCRGADRVRGLYDLGDNDAWSPTIRNHLDGLGLYEPISSTPLLSNAPKDKAIKYAEAITNICNYGDVLIYYATPEPRTELVRGERKPRYHAQIYTGNLYRDGQGWSTSTKNNYGVTFVYRSSSINTWTLYWYRVKQVFVTA